MNDVPVSPSELQVGDHIQIPATHDYPGDVAEVHATEAADNGDVELIITHDHVTHAGVEIEMSGQLTLSDDETLKRIR